MKLLDDAIIFNGAGLFTSFSNITLPELFREYHCFVENLLKNLYNLLHCRKILYILIHSWFLSISAQFLENLAVRYSCAQNFTHKVNIKVANLLK